MTLPWWCHLAFKQVFPSGRRFSLQTVFYLFSMMGVAMGVFLVLVSQCIMGGFGRQWSEKTIDVGGHLSVVSEEGPMRDWLAEYRRLSGEPGVVAVAPFATGVGLLQSRVNGREFLQFPAVVGMETEQGTKVLPLGKYLNEWVDPRSLEGNNVFLGRGLAYALGVGEGSVVQFHSPLMLQRLEKNEVLLPKELRVAGIFHTGYPDVDNRTMIMPLDLAQEAFGLGDSVHILNLRLASDDLVAPLKDRLSKSRTAPLRVLDWRDKGGDFLFALETERMLVLLLTIPIYIVSGFVIVCTQLINVFSKTREIGLVGALGGAPSGLLKLYCFQGSILGACGALLGLGMALAFLGCRSNIVGLINRFSDSDQALNAVYMFEQLPVVYEPGRIAIVLLSAVLMSVLASFIPALVAAFKKPAEALRSE